MVYTIEQARNLRGFTQPEMATILGMTVSTYVQREKYRKHMDALQIVKFLKATGFEYSEIIFVKE